MTSNERGLDLSVAMRKQEAAEAQIQMMVRGFILETAKSLYVKETDVNLHTEETMRHLARDCDLAAGYLAEQIFPGLKIERG